MYRWQYPIHSGILQSFVWSRINIYSIEDWLFLIIVSLQKWIANFYCSKTYKPGKTTIYFTLLIRLRFQGYRWKSGFFIQNKENWNSYLIRILPYWQMSFMTCLMVSPLQVDIFLIFSGFVILFLFNLTLGSTELYRGQLGESRSILWIFSLKIMFLPSLYWVTLIKLDHAHSSKLVFGVFRENLKISDLNFKRLIFKF